MCIWKPLVVEAHQYLKAFQLFLFSSLLYFNCRVSDLLKGEFLCGIEADAISWAETGASS